MKVSWGGASDWFILMTVLSPYIFLLYENCMQLIIHTVNTTYCQLISGTKIQAISGHRIDILIKFQIVKSLAGNDILYPLDYCEQYSLSSICSISSMSNKLQAV